MVPVSFTPARLLNCDTVKSPIVAVNGKINPIIISNVELVSFEKKSKLNKTKLMMTDIINPAYKTFPGFIWRYIWYHLCAFRIWYQSNNKMCQKSMSI